jgi:aspartyl/asparaginyl-tRNA synthetase
VQEPDHLEELEMELSADLSLDKLTRPAYLTIMEKKKFRGREIPGGKAPQDAPVTVKRWGRTRRDSKAWISFVHLSDGSSFHPVQVVAPNTLPNYEGEVLKLTGRCAVKRTVAGEGQPSKCRRALSA